MTFFRFSLRWLLAGVGFIAMACAGLMYASTTTAGVILTSAIGLLVVAPLGIAYRTGGQRAFWVGFTLCGWTYLTLNLGPWFDKHLSSKLSTSHALDAVWQGLAQAPSRGIEPGASVRNQWAQDDVWYWVIERQDGTSYQISKPAPPSFETIKTTGHALFAILAGVIGGLAGKWFSLTRDAHHGVG